MWMLTSIIMLNNSNGYSLTNSLLIIIKKTYFQDYFFSSPIIIINLLKYYQLLLLLKLHLSTLDIQSKIHVLIQETYFLSSFLSCLLSNRFSNNNMSTSWYHVFITIHVHNRSHVPGSWSAVWNNLYCNNGMVLQSLI